MEKDLKSIKPYCYILTRLSDGIKYHGVRWANVKKKLAPLQDLGISYFSSHKVLSKEFKNNKDNFQFKVTKIFSNKEEAIIFEKKINKKLIYNKNWANKQAFPAINNEIHPMLGRKVSNETRRKISDANKGIKLKDKLTDAQYIKWLTTIKTGDKHHFYGKGMGKNALLETISVPLL